MQKINSDTICALATPAGGAIAVIRLSGKNSISISDKIFTSINNKSLYEAKANSIHYGTIKDVSGKIVDDVLISVFHNPHSYTGEDSVEISCHGSKFIIQQILLLLQANGARQAAPGEYTRRAYLNGKMDLSQAEAVADLIAATNKASHDIAVNQLRGHVRTALDKLRERLQKLTALLELELDFSDHEDLEFADRTELINLADEIDYRLTNLAESYRTGKALKEGIPVAIVGKTNVGKSTLLNRFLDEDRAIVSDIPGTTRDSIEDTIDINGVTFRFIDTAGLRQTCDKVEKIGINRSYKAIERSSIVLWLIDVLPTEAEMAEMLKLTKNKKIIIVVNKCDLKNTELLDTQIKAMAPNIKIEKISAKMGEGIEALKRSIFETANIPEINETDVIVSSARQYALLKEALINLHRVIEGLHSNVSSDLIAEDLRLVISNIGEITGVERITPASTLNLIFSTFCIGK